MIFPLAPAGRRPKGGKIISNAEGCRQHATQFEKIAVTKDSESCHSIDWLHLDHTKDALRMFAMQRETFQRDDSGMILSGYECDFFDLSL